LFPDITIGALAIISPALVLLGPFIFFSTSFSSVPLLLQKEIGRELRSHELVRAANSIRRANVYIENILDNKFVLDSSHGINHIKHNLEYGYSLMNLIELPRRRSRRNYG
jgi:hypothetical protein